MRTLRRLALRALALAGRLPDWPHMYDGLAITNFWTNFPCRSGDPSGYQVWLNLRSIARLQLAKLRQQPRLTILRLGSNTGSHRRRQRKGVGRRIEPQRRPARQAPLDVAANSTDAHRLQVSVWLAARPHAVQEILGVGYVVVVAAVSFLISLPFSS